MTEDEGQTARRVLRVSIGEFVVSDRSDDVITTVALGSCIAVCLWEPKARVAGMLHFMLPDAALNKERAREQPAVFANTGIPLLFRAAYELGADKKRCAVRLVGGAELAAGGRAEGDGAGVFDVGRRNVLAARAVLWRNGIMTGGELVGGTTARTIAMSVGDGKVIVKTDGAVVAEL
ncbi:MAG TPA: chemotaxis protein CheD [Vicinamibacterales bacterium]|nr:chemotaxis protein CheD [Vicinamibacterales bacterium]